jgi:hypothetical protein
VKVKRTAWQCCHGAFESKHELRRLFARYVMELRSRRVSQRPTRTVLHERWLPECVCNSLRQTQRRCWLQMAGCGLGCAIIAHRASHPRSPHGTAVRVIHNHERLYSRTNST